MSTSTLQIIISAKDSASSAIKGIHGELNKFSNSTVFRSIAGGAKMAAAGVGILGGALVTAGAFALKSAANYEQNRIAFEAMLGSAEKASGLLKKISDFAAKTPFELPDVVEGSKRLLAYNISAEKIIPTFQKLGDIAAGVGTEKLPQLITAFGQVAAKGKLMGGELLQFTEAGVGLGTELQKMFGVGREKLEDMISSGKVGFAQVEQAITNMTSKGGLYFGQMEKQATSFNGILSNVSDSFGKVAREIIGINEQGDIKEGSIFARLKMAAESLLKWLDANKDAIAQKIQYFIDSAIQKGNQWITQMGGKDGIIEKLKETEKTIVAVMNVIGFLSSSVGIVIRGWSSFGQIIQLHKEIFSAYVSIVKSRWSEAVSWVEIGIGKMKKLFENFSIGKAFDSAMDSVINAVKRAIDWVNKLIAGYNRFANTKGNPLPSISEIRYGGRATGGSVMAGKPYMVGERGPELFVPSQSGRIENNPTTNNRTEMVFNFNFEGAFIGDKEQFMREIQQTINRKQELYAMGASAL